MLTYKDCLEMCDFTKEEIKAIADHEHISGMSAILLAEELLHEQGGVFKIQRMIMDDIEMALQQHDGGRAGQLKKVLHHFIETHPDALRLER